MDAGSTTLRSPTSVIIVAQNAAVPSGCRAPFSFLQSAAVPGSYRAASSPSQICVSSKPWPILSQQPLDRRGFLGLLGTLSLGFSASVVEHPALAVPSCDFTVAPSGLGFCDISPGSGLPASQGMLIKANYVGKLEDGKVFDSSYDRGRPLTFKIGVGQVIRGWDEGILGSEGVPPMLAGGRRRLRIPPQLGYGERGAGCRAGSCLIPPNSVLLFDVEFVGKAY